jgi:hypothetical protein
VTQRLAAYLLWVADLTARQFTLRPVGDRLRWTVTPAFASAEPDLCRVIVEALRTHKEQVLELLNDRTFAEFIGLARTVHTNQRRQFVRLFVQRINAHLASGKGTESAKRAALEDCCDVVIEGKGALTTGTHQPSIRSSHAD